VATILTNQLTKFSAIENIFPGLSRTLNFNKKNPGFSRRRENPVKISSPNLAIVTGLQAISALRLLTEFKRSACLMEVSAASAC